MEVGDRVYAGDWCEGVITEIDGDEMRIEFETSCGGGSIWFSAKDVKTVEAVK